MSQDNSDKETLKPNFFEWTVPYFGSHSYSRRSFARGLGDPPGYTSTIYKLTMVHLAEIFAIPALGFAIGTGLEKLLN